MSGPSHHTVNVLAVAVPSVSFFVNAAPVVTVVAGTLGIIWYGILFYREIKDWFKRKGPPN